MTGSREKHFEKDRLRSGVVSPTVNSHNEWDPLEEAVVGILDEARPLVAVKVFSSAADARSAAEHYGAVDSRGTLHYTTRVILGLV